MTEAARHFTRNRRFAGIALLVVVAGAAGCSSASTGSTTTTTTAAPRASSTTSTSTAPTTTSSTTSTSTSSTTTIAASNAFASSLLNKFQSSERATFVATYKLTSATHSLSSLTIAQQSPNELFEGTSSTGTFQLFSLGTKSYICSKSAATTSCFSTAAETSEAELFAAYEPGTYLPYFEAAASAAGAHTSTSSRTVNGFALSCVTVSGLKGETGTGTFCVTSQGVLGYVSWTGTSSSGSFEIESYSTSVPAGEFTLPAKPTTVP
jgi:hypothetical protein